MTGYPTLDENDFAVFVIALYRPPSKEYPDACILWAGTNHPVVNDLFCQALDLEAWPFTARDLGLITSGHRGLYFPFPQTAYVNEADMARLTEVLGEKARQAAEQQGYRFEALDHTPGDEGITYLIMEMNFTLSRRNFSADWDEDEVEEE